PSHAANSSFSIGYTYINNLNFTKNGTVNVQYRARNGQAFVANGGSTLATCDVQLNGSLADCTTVGQGFGVALGLATDDDFVYVSHGRTGPRPVRFCLANNDGTLSNCTTELSGQTGLQFLSATDTHLYIARGDATVQSCAIGSDGRLGTCVATG